ncbi:hypothetical protein AHAS_Ahas15G0343700 [Arachis hypogaea]
MLEDEVEVVQVIPQEIYNIAFNASTHAKLAFLHLIYCLCDAHIVHIEHDTLIPIKRPIFRKRMEYPQEYARAPREEPAAQGQPVLPPQQEQPLMPKGHYFPPQEYWH